MYINKYFVRKLFSSKIEKIKILPGFLRYFATSDIDILDNEEILLDHITNEDISLWYFRNSDIGYPEIYIKGSFEKDEINLIKKILPENGIVLDIGANIGYHSIIMSKIVGNKGKVFAFEPYNKNVTLLQKNKYQNNLENIEIYKLAIGNQNKKATLKVFNDYAYNSILDSNRKKYITTEEVIMKTIDTFVSTKQFDRIDLIKIDVEGYELNVLKGARKTLETYHPKIICEIFQQNLDPLKITVRDVLNYIMDFGYKGFIINGENLKIINKTKEKFDYYNFYFE